MNASQFGWSRALLLTAILAALGGIVGATIPDPSGVYHGCLKNGNLRVIDSATESCKQNETPITWNQTGPDGIQGPQGPQGIQGPQGAQRAAGAGRNSGATGWAMLGQQAAVRGLRQRDRDRPGHRANLAEELCLSGANGLCGCEHGGPNASGGAVWLD